MEVEVLGSREIVERAAMLAMMSGTAAHVVGPTGYGKTDMASHIAEMTGREFYAFNSAINNTEDLIGIPYIDHETKETHWTKPFWFPKHGKYLLLIDEINRAEKNTLNALLPFILSGSLHEHVLPKGVWIMTASNPDTDDYDLVNSFEDRAVFSRMCMLNLGIDTLSWRNWVKSTGRATKHLENLMESTLQNADKVLPDIQKPNPRSFAKMVDMIKTAKKYNAENNDKFFTEEVLLTACKGIVGADFVSINSTAIISEFQEDVERTLGEILDTEVDIVNMLQIKNELLRALEKPVQDEVMIDRLFEFVKENSKKFPGQFLEVLPEIKGPYIGRVTEMMITIKNMEADMYNQKLKKYNKEDN
jgi:MoxR-like ATPase